MFRRYCTTEMKILPIVEWVYYHIMAYHENMPVFNNTGIRYDELERCKNGIERELRQKIKVGKSANGNNKWKEIFWAVANYPLVYNKVHHYKIVQYWNNENDIDFPDDSNCVGCFWKMEQQLRKNFDTNENKMDWFASQEKIKKQAYWKENITYDSIKRLGLQQDFNFGTGAGCQAGFCTD